MEQSMKAEGTDTQATSPSGIVLLLMQSGKKIHPPPKVAFFCRCAGARRAGVHGSVLVLARGGGACLILRQAPSRHSQHWEIQDLIKQSSDSQSRELTKQREDLT